MVDKKDIVLSIRLSKNNLKRLDAVTKVLGRSNRSDTIRFLLYGYITKEGD